MSTAESLPVTSSAAAEPISGNVSLAGIALSSFAALLLELSLTRLFSVVLFYHFAFLAISVALLGLGAGGVFAHIRRARLSRIDTRTLAALCAAFASISIPITLEVVLHVPVSLKLTGGNFLRLTLIYLVSAVPFFLTGLQFSVIFARMSAQIPRMYAADLGGGALACLLVVPLLNWIGGPNAILFAAFAAALAAVLWSPSSRLKSKTAALAITMLVLMAFNHSGKVADVVWAKGIRRKNVEYARWNAISRTEVDRLDDGAKVAVIDADASTYLMNADPQNWPNSAIQGRLMASPPAVANVLRPHGEYAIVGPGGGVDVLRAVANGSPGVTGIEINSIIANDVMRGRYANFTYHLYERPEVHIHVADGRSFIRRTSQRFDVVQMTLVDTWASTAAGAFALSENNLYTTEAFREYFDHLKPDGIVAITRWEFRRPREALRVASVAINALHELGTKEVPNHFIVVSQSELNEDGIHVGVLAKRTPFSEQEEQMVREHVARNPPMRVLYSPAGNEDNAFSRLIRSGDPYTFSRGYDYNVSPVTDNAPFFFFTLKPAQLLHLRTRHSMDWKVNVGVAVLGMLLAISVLAVAAFLVVPLLLQGGSGRSTAGTLPYFVAVGLGYILVEVTFVQRFVLFLGHPTYALTVVIFLLLLASGVGSALSRRLSPDGSGIWAPLVAIVATLLVYIAVLPRVLNHFVGAEFSGKIAISALLLAPLGLVMGMPFPTGLRALIVRLQSGHTDDSIEWAWAMNAAASVLGSVLAIVIAIQFGFTLTLSCGAAAYVVALLFYRRLHYPQLLR